MTRFPYHFRSRSTRECAAGPSLMGCPVIYAPTLTTTNGLRYVYVEHAEYGVPRTILTNDPDYEWNFYRLECQHQARMIVRDGLTRRLPWLRDEPTRGELTT